MKEYKITDILGKNFSISHEDGIIVRDFCNKIIKKEDIITLDFKHIFMLSEEFLGALILNLIKKYKKENIKNIVKFKNIEQEEFFYSFINKKL